MAFRTRPATRRSSLELEVAPTSVRAARHWAADLLAQPRPPHHPDLVDAVVLLVSEMVTNAITAVNKLAAGIDGQPTHGVQPRVWLAITCSPDLVRIEVHDTAFIPVPPSHHADDFEESGRGLEVISLLACHWGWNTEALGKVVWCELPASGSLPAGQ